MTDPFLIGGDGLPETMSRDMPGLMSTLFCAFVQSVRPRHRDNPITEGFI